jgi:tetratricopeptide (TPR) repeat protein
MDRGELDEWLALLERDELVERRGPARAFAGELEYAFRHDLLKDASYQMLTPEDRRAGHRLAGAWLVAHGEADAVVLAEHFAGGGAMAQAVNWFERAAETALAGGADDVAALRKAAAYYRRAGETCAAAYANDAAIAHLERAAALFASIDPIEAARTRLALAKVREVSGEPDAALEDLRAAEEEAGANAELRVEILLSRSYVLGRSGREGALDHGIETAEAALALAKGAGRDLELRATTTLAGLLARMETAASIQRSVELAQRALAMSEDRRDLGLAVWRLANAFLTGNQLDSAARLYDDALVSAEAEHDEYLVAMCHANMAMLAFRRWRLDDAIDHAHQALERHERIGYQTRILETTLNLGMFLHLRGESERGRELLGNVLAQSRSDWFLSTLAQETLADVERFAGREARAQARLRSAARTCERVGIPNKQALYLGMLAESQWAVGDAGAAIEALEEGAKAASSLTLSHAYVLLHLGQLEDAIDWLGRFADGEPDPQRRAQARLGLARASLWNQQRDAARRECDVALAIVSPTSVPRFALPIQCLRATLDGDLHSAVALLDETAQACAPFERAEAALDVGEGLLTGQPASADIVRYLAATRDIAHRGIRYHIEDIRAQLFERLGDVEHARECVSHSHEELDRLLEKLNDEYRGKLESHPWVRSIRRLRVVP